MKAYPVPRLSDQIAMEWAPLLAERFHVEVEEFVKQPQRYIRYKNETCRAELMDGSTVEFRWAFAIVSEKENAVAIFSEHSGNHVFPLHEAKIFKDGTLIYAAE